MELTIKNLENCFKEAKKNNAKYIGLKLGIADGNWYEIISTENFKYFLEAKYIEKGANVLATTYGNTFEDIEKDLLLN